MASMPDCMGMTHWMNMFAQLDLYVSGLSMIIRVLLVRIEKIREYVQEGLHMNLRKP